MTTHPALTEGRVAVITGASSGIGLAAARRFAAMGLKVCLADRSAEALEKAASEVAAVPMMPTAAPAEQRIFTAASAASTMLMKGSWLAAIRSGSQ